jgi:hypothetical protein
LNIAGKHFANFGITALLLLNHKPKMTDPATIPAEFSRHTEKHPRHSQPTFEDRDPGHSGSTEVAKEENSEKDSLPAEIGERKYVTGLKLLFVLSGVTLVLFLVMLDISIISTVSSYLFSPLGDFFDIRQAIPRITTEFHSLKDIGWYGSSYQMAR